MSNLVLKNISKVYPSRDKKFRNGVKAVDNFSMEIKDNEFIVFVGPSGCGKSTTLRMIAGLEDITSGELYIDDQYMNDVEPKNRDIAMVFQNYALYPHMNAYKNIAFGLTIRKVKEYKYIQNDETIAALATIKNIQKENEEIRKSNLKNQKALDKLFLKKYSDEKFIEDIEFYLTNDPTLDVSKPSVQKKMIKLNEQKKVIQERLEKTNSDIESLQELMQSKRDQIDKNFLEIDYLKDSIKEFIDCRISEKLIQKYQKSLNYYLGVQKKDEFLFYQTTQSLEKVENEINESLLLKEQIDDEEELFKLDLKLRGLNNQKNLLLENIETLNYRKEVLEDSIENASNKLEHYKVTPEPLVYYRHYTKAEIDKRVKKAADILEINQILGRKPREMSGGQRQRIALGRAIVREPKVFLLDEPLSNLDAKLRAAMRVEISKLHESLKTTFIYVTHDQVEAMTMGTRIVVMKDGIVQQIDTPTGLFDYPVNVFVAGFIGTPQMNFFEAILKKVDNTLEVLYNSGIKQIYDLSKVRKIKEEYLDGNDHKVIIGVRGESIYLNETGIESKIDAIEVLGNETNIYLTLNNNQDKKVSLIVKGRPDLKVGDTIHVSFKDSDLYIFDKDSEESIIIKN